MLILLSGGLVLFSWFMPWWSARVQEIRGNEHVVIHPWGLQVNEHKILTYMPDNVNLALPDWIAPTMWLYIGLVVAALLFSLFAKDKMLTIWKVKASLPTLLIGVVGLSYLISIFTATIIIAMRLTQAGMPMMGKVTVTVGSDVGTGIVYTGLQVGYWAGIAAGVILVVLALLRSKIIGAPTSAERPVGSAKVPATERTAPA
ncbi:MAG: hypothetical protein U0556_02900 [Dehalococcoidia bacterium]